ncbi:glycosyltransferase family 2 protein [Bacteroides sp. AN502(2024)]|uniref:glycosyltransferase family 2 protein n=1 Tax=Bacteroides sp. AN502(2024) TaxID=3160599 RepID=UPI003512A9EB
MLSVICPIYNEEKYIGACIESILAQDYPKDDLEVIFADGMSTDRTREIVAAYMAKYPWIRLIDNPDRIVPPALNKAIEASCGDIIMRLDAHASYADNYFSALVSGIDKYEADNIGAVCKTDVLNKTPRSLAIRAVLAHPLGVGNSTFRTGISEVKEVDTVPFGCWKRSVFERFGRFDERLVRNQDIEFNKRIHRGGGKIVIIPDTYSTYYARETYSKLAKNNYGNGKWNILTVWYTRQFKSLSLRHFIPLVFILSLILPVVAALFWTPMIWLAVFSLLGYTIVISAVSLDIAKKQKLRFINLFKTFFVLHLSYGWGSLSGIIETPFVKI